jgi:hypothetical protein
VSRAGEAAVSFDAGVMSEDVLHSKNVAGSGGRVTYLLRVLRPKVASQTAPAARDLSRQQEIFARQRRLRVQLTPGRRGMRAAPTAALLL